MLGWFAFAGATFIVAAWMAGWYASPASPDYLFPFAALVGGLALLAGMWSYRARDVLATAMEDLGRVLAGLGRSLGPVRDRKAPEPIGTFSSLGYWFVALAIITASGAVAALARGLGLFALLSALTAGSALTAAAYLANSDMTLKIAGYFLIVSAAIAWYEATAMLLADSFRRVVLPLGTYSRVDNVPGAESMRVIEWPLGEPGVKHGQ